VLREKRRFTRVEINLFVSIYLYQIETYRTGWLANISTGGCFLPLDGEFTVGEECHLTITVGEGLETDTFSVSGQVVRIDSSGVGIQFHNDSEQQNQKLEKIISQHASSS